MGSFLHTLVFFIVALAILIAFHEFGHFWVARRLGVKVIRFSIGFGKAIWKYQKDSASTEYLVAAIPLGGYVKMVDEREGEVAPEDIPYAFNRQSLKARSAIVLAGPLFNLALAVLIFWGILINGETGFRPLLGEVEPGTIASQAGFEKGDEILEVDG
ncbi:MAG: RIP metalloprotease RseP, partial [Methylococcales bacterium]